MNATSIAPPFSRLYTNLLRSCDRSGPSGDVYVLVLYIATRAPRRSSQRGDFAEPVHALGDQSALGRRKLSAPAPCRSLNPDEIRPARACSGVSLRLRNESWLQVSRRPAGRGRTCSSRTTRDAAAALGPAQCTMVWNVAHQQAFPVAHVRPSAKLKRAGHRRPNLALSFFIIGPPCPVSGLPNSWARTPADG